MSGLSKWKKIGLLCGAALVLMVLGYVFLSGGNSRRAVLPEAAPDGYIFDKTYDVPLKDIVKSHGVASPEDSVNQAKASAEPGRYSQVAVSNYFDEGMGVTVFTRKYFKYLEKRFKHSKDLESHLAEVKAFLLSQLPEDEAMELFALYTDYLNCEMDLAYAQESWGQPTTVEEVVALLARIQAYRRDYLGKEVADALYGAEIKTKEYRVRRGAIVADRELYGEEKEALLAQLNEDMWGDQTSDVEAYGLPYNRYQEKLRIYQKDFSEMTSPEDKEALTREFREEFFTPEQVAALDEVDVMLAEKQTIENQLQAKEQEIESNPDLTQEQKDAAIEQAADEMLGEDAPAYFRRKAIRDGKKDLMQEQGLN
ncbi:conserved hypothetical protein [Desulfatibacillum aliphaticivorans]|uniref:Lipase helper protein n=1 Tax=Desulfatibacillum aliphaticivorans TaxID=218208 RepID=B8FCZ4_DESAL|nr:lipase secretion chaperone [Desulfatibacillum aliphaticivorans]ACL06425.1 conserved hypothetical protein [Desulfatibacillum aliphaticivorans]